MDASPIGGPSVTWTLEEGAALHVFCCDMNASLAEVILVFDGGDSDPLLAVMCCQQWRQQVAAMCDHLSVRYALVPSVCSLSYGSVWLHALYLWAARTWALG